MSLKHKSSKCNASYICQKCNGRHRISIFQKGNLKSTGGNILGAGKKSTNVQPALPATNQHETQKIPNSFQQNKKN